MTTRKTKKALARRKAAKRRTVPLRAGTILYFEGRPECVRKLKRSTGRHKGKWEVVSARNVRQWGPPPAEEMRRLLSREDPYARTPGKREVVSARTPGKRRPL